MLSSCGAVVGGWWETVGEVGVARGGQTGVEISISRDRNKGGKSEGQCDGAYLCLLGDLRVIRFLRDGRHIQRLVAAG